MLMVLEQQISQRFLPMWETDPTTATQICRAYGVALHNTSHALTHLAAYIVNQGAEQGFEIALPFLEMLSLAFATTILTTGEAGRIDPKPAPESCSPPSFEELAALNRLLN